MEVCDTAIIDCRLKRTRFSRQDRLFRNPIGRPFLNERGRKVNFLLFLFPPWGLWQGRLSQPSAWMRHGFVANAGPKGNPFVPRPSPSVRTVEDNGPYRGTAGATSLRNGSDAKSHAIRRALTHAEIRWYNLRKFYGDCGCDISGSRRIGHG